MPRRKQKKLLTINDLYNFYSSKKNSLTFSEEKSGYTIAVQTDAKFELSDGLSEGLLYGKIRAFHDLTNNNKSHIETDILEEKMMSLKDRPIMADIIETDQVDEDGNPIKDFSGHTMEYNEELDKFVYKELPVGHFVNPENIHTEYDEEYERNFVVSDIVIYEEYTNTCEILRRRQTVDCSVELCIRKMHWNATEHVLYLDDFYVQGCTLLGANYAPGMAGSRLTLKDFSQENNSLFSDFSKIEQSKLIETLDKLNETLTTISNFNINSQSQLDNEQEKGGNDKVMFKSLLEKYNKTVEDITFDYESMSDEELQVKFAELFEDNTDDAKDDPEDDTVTDEGSSDADNDTDDDSETDDETNDDTIVKEDNSCNDDKDKEDHSLNDTTTFTKTFSVSHEDLRGILYTLLAPLEETLNDCYWIVSTYDNYFIYQSYLGNYFKQKFTVDNDNVAFDGEREEVFAEFVNASEKEELDSMRSNYSTISEKLAKYEEAEELDDKMTVFSDDAYAEYLETEEFKSLMTKETLKQFTKDELVEKADAALGKLNRTTKTFAKTDDTKTEKPKAQSFFAFSRNEQTTSFLDGLLKK
jgi:hypothetical protein